MQYRQPSFPGFPFFSSHACHNRAAIDAHRDYSMHRPACTLQRWKTPRDNKQRGCMGWARMDAHACTSAPRAALLTKTARQLGSTKPNNVSTVLCVQPNSVDRSLSRCIVPKWHGNLAFSELSYQNFHKSWSQYIRKLLFVINNFDHLWTIFFVANNFLHYFSILIIKSVIL